MKKQKFINHSPPPCSMPCANTMTSFSSSPIIIKRRNSQLSLWTRPEAYLQSRWKWCTRSRSWSSSAVLTKFTMIFYSWQNRQPSLQSTWFSPGSSKNSKKIIRSFHHPIKSPQFRHPPSPWWSLTHNNYYVPHKIKMKYSFTPSTKKINKFIRNLASLQSFNHLDTKIIPKPNSSTILITWKPTVLQRLFCCTVEVSAKMPSCKSYQSTWCSCMSLLNYPWKATLLVHCQTWPLNPNWQLLKSLMNLRILNLRHNLTLTNFINFSSNTQISPIHKKLNVHTIYWVSCWPILYQTPTNKITEKLKEWISRCKSY